MKSIAESMLVLSVLMFMGCLQQSGDSGAELHDASESGSIRIADQIVEASCGQCQFGMQGSGCDLAVRIDGNCYYVDGTSIDDHGDAHGDEGFCNCIRNASVTGEIRDGRFMATGFSVLPNQDLP